MGQQQDSTEATKRYEEARAKLAWLYDHADRTVSVDVYRARIRAAQDASNSAHAAMLAARRG
jgi:hypothetical protein